MKAALIVDVRSIYNQVSRAFNGRVLSYETLIERLEALYHLKFLNKVAYVEQNREEAQSFIYFLEAKGFEVYEANDIEMALRCATIIDKVDALVVASGNWDHGRLLKYANYQGKFAYAVGTTFPVMFKNYAKLHTITEDLTREKKNGGKQLELPAQSCGEAAPAQGSGDIPF